jgi:hypothetical protein
MQLPTKPELRFYPTQDVAGRESNVKSAGDAAAGLYAFVFVNLAFALAVEMAVE